MKEDLDLTDPRQQVNHFENDTHGDDQTHFNKQVLNIFVLSHNSNFCKRRNWTDL